MSKVYIGAEFKALRTTTLAFVFANWYVLESRSVGRTIRGSEFLAMGLLFYAVDSTCVTCSPRILPRRHHRAAILPYRLSGDMVRLPGARNPAQIAL